MKAIVIDKDVVTRMTKMTWRKNWVNKLLADASDRWENRYKNLLWDEEAMESDLGSDYIVEELLDETKKELRRWEHHLGFDKKEVIEPDWGYTE